MTGLTQSSLEMTINSIGLVIVWISIKRKILWMLDIIQLRMAYLPVSYLTTSNPCPVSISAPYFNCIVYLEFFINTLSLCILLISVLLHVKELFFDVLYVIFITSCYNLRLPYIKPVADVCLYIRISAIVSNVLCYKCGWT